MIRLPQSTWQRDSFGSKAEIVEAGPFADPASSFREMERPIEEKKFDLWAKREGFSAD